MAKQSEFKLSEALDSYLNVVNAQFDPEKLNETEWKWYERCGLASLGLLEREKRWRAAIQIAEKIAGGGAPYALDFAARAKKLRLTHGIWEQR